jgi:TrkA domain protein
MAIIRESDLPGIGRKFLVQTISGDKMVIVIHDDGRRDIYHFEENDPDEIISSISLDDAEARQIGSIIGGMNYMPKALETIEVALDELIIEWLKVESHYKSVGKCIADLQVREKTGATILAIVEKHKQRINPGPDDIIVTDSTIVAAGVRKQIRALKELLVQG